MHIVLLPSEVYCTQSPVLHTQISSPKHVRAFLVIFSSSEIGNVIAKQFIVNDDLISLPPIILVERFGCSSAG